MDRPGYLKLAESGELERRAALAQARLADCRMCPRNCGAERTSPDPVDWGFCRTGAGPKVSSYGPHFGEEEPLVGEGGSGTIFLTGCNLRCRFCQNEDISLDDRGQDISPADLAALMLDLQSRGCANINFVTPSHQVAALLAGLKIAAEQGLNLPLVYNSGGYDSLQTLALLDGVIDIYMPDCKFTEPEVAARLCGAPDYWAINQAAVTEMHRQVGDLVIDPDGLARRGLLVRHLVLPGGLAGTRKAADFLSSLSDRTYVNIMAQYRPCAEADRISPLERAITQEEYARALTEVMLAGLSRLDKPGLGRFF